VAQPPSQGGEAGGRDWERLLVAHRPAVPTPRAAVRARPAHPYRPGPRVRDLRDQLGLKIGWIRFWLRGVGLGVGLAFLGVSLAMWRPLASLAGPFFVLGLLVAPIAGLAALATWALPYPWLQAECACPRCGHVERVLRLPWRTRHTCRRCLRRGYLLGGVLHLADAEGPPAHGAARGA
jgi:hypothetical protein